MVNSSRVPACDWLEKFAVNFSSVKVSRIGQIAFSFQYFPRFSFYLCISFASRASQMLVPTAGRRLQVSSHNNRVLFKIGPVNVMKPELSKIIRFY